MKICLHHPHHPRCKRRNFPNFVFVVLKILWNENLSYDQQKFVCIDPALDISLSAQISEKFSQKETEFCVETKSLCNSSTYPTPCQTTPIPLRLGMDCCSKSTEKAGLSTTTAFSNARPQDLQLGSYHFLC